MDAVSDFDDAKGSKFYAEIVDAYLRYVREGLVRPEERLWELAKERAEVRRQCEEAEAMAEREGLDYGAVLRRERLKREALKVN